MSIYATSSLIHGGFGFLALLAFWVAAFARKGSAPHRFAGKVFLLAMSGVLLFALPLGLIITRIGNVFGPFLLFLILTVATTCWVAWRAIRDRRDFARFAGPIYRALAYANLLAGVAMLGWGIMQSSIVFAAFSLIGIFNGLGMLRTARRPPTDSLWWQAQHRNAMLGNGAATHIAFFVIGLPRLLPDYAGPTQQTLAWLAPLVVALGVRFWMARRPQRARAVAAALPSG
jgi:hypothetical protein